MSATNYVQGENNDCDVPDFMTMQQLLKELPISRATAYRWIKSGDLPRPIKLGPSRIVFVRSEVSTCLANRPRA